VSAQRRERDGRESVAARAHAGLVNVRPRDIVQRVIAAPTSSTRFLRKKLPTAFANTWMARVKQ
jgi:hypothetical protein